MEDTDASSSDSFKSENSDEKQNFRKQYELSNIIGTGSFGIVYEGERISDNNPVVTKKILKKNIQRWEHIDGVHMPKEVAILRKLAHVPGVVKIIGALDCEPHYMIVMEKLESSKNLEDSVIPVTESKAINYIKQIIQTLLACYEAGVVHRDIKPANILLELNTEKLYLIDFGSAAYVENEPFHDVVGAILYYPPESFTSKRYYGNSSTVWAIGVLFYELLTGNVPFQSESKICFDEVIFPKEVSPACEDIVRQCLRKNREERPKLESLLAHHVFMELSCLQIPNSSTILFQ